jgi:hypothetical protein
MRAGQKPTRVTPPACRRTAALGIEKCMREKLFGLNRELTLRHGLRRYVNELIPSIKFTSSERGEFSPEATASGQSSG